MIRSSSPVSHTCIVMTSPLVGTKEELARRAGAGTVVQRYLKERGIWSVGALSMLARDDDAFAEAIIEPLLRGFGTGHEMLELSEVERPIAKALLLYMFHLAREAHRLRLHQISSGSVHRVILLSFFDGVGATLEWDIDPCALAVSSRACRCLRMKRGDVTADDPEAMATMLRDRLKERNSTVLGTAGPTCPDYSRLLWRLWSAFCAVHGVPEEA